MEIKNNEYKNTSLLMNRNKSTGNLFEKDINYKNNFIPDSRMEQYLNEYYNYLYSTKNSDKENSNTNISTNINNINNPKFNSINLPDDLLIEYNNRKRLDELRKKYLSNTSLRFLRKKDEVKINNHKLEEEKKNNEINKEDELKNIIFELNLKYDKLKEELNKTLIENKKIEIDEEKNKNLYKNYLIKENKELKSVNNNYEIILELLISYINKTNKLFLNSEKIDYFNLRQNIINKKTRCINELSAFLKNCKKKLDDNINKGDYNYNKIKINEKKIINIKGNLSKREKKSKNNFKYTLSTVSFRNKIANSSIESIEQIKSKTLNKSRINGVKRPRINLIKNKEKRK